MTRLDPADWHELGIAPTEDPLAVRTAYRTRLRTTGPETDPAGFERLRAAYDRIILALTTIPERTDDTGGQDEHAPPTAAELEALEIANRVNDHRLAGDVDGGIAYLDERLAAIPPGTDLATALEMHLFYGTALVRSVSPRLFRYLVERFDWTDMQGPVAQEHPQAHGVAIDRLAAEDWWEECKAAGRADPPDRVAAALAGPMQETRDMLRRRGLSDDERAHVRQRFDELGLHARFLLPRMDGGSLALLREAVEGEPSVDIAPAAAPLPPPRASTTAREQPVDSGGVAGWLKKAALAGALALAGIGVVTLFGDGIGNGGGDADGGVAQTNPGAPSAEVAMAQLRDPATDWVDIDRNAGAVTVMWTPLLRWRSGILEMRMAVDRPPTGPNIQVADFDTMYPMPVAPMMNTLTVQLRYADGEWSDVRRYDISGVEL
ncbi:MAG: hypothetical protein WA948_03960 [Pontixanthobacter sp.]